MNSFKEENISEGEINFDKNEKLNGIKSKFHVNGW